MHEMAVTSKHMERLLYLPGPDRKENKSVSHCHGKPWGILVHLQDQTEWKQEKVVKVEGIFHSATSEERSSDSEIRSSLHFKRLRICTFIKKNVQFDSTLRKSYLIYVHVFQMVSFFKGFRKKNSLYTSVSPRALCTHFLLVLFSSFHSSFIIYFSRGP